jgi:hypothetical protein
MPNQIPLYTALAANEARACALRGCKKPRRKLAKHCRLHDERRRKWGHAVAGKCWRGGDIDSYREVAEAFLTNHADHPGIKLGVEWLEAALVKAVEFAEGRAYGQVSRALKHLADRGVSGQELLVRAVATTLYMIELPDHLQELAPYSRNLGHHCLRAAPGLATGERQRQYSASVGAYIYSGLKPLLLRIIVHKQQLDRQKQRFEAAAAQPFASAE